MIGMTAVARFAASTGSAGSVKVYVDSGTTANTVVAGNPASVIKVLSDE